MYNIDRSNICGLWKDRIILSQDVLHVLFFFFLTTTIPAVYTKLPKHFLQPSPWMTQYIAIVSTHSPLYLEESSSLKRDAMYTYTGYPHTTLRVKFGELLKKGRSKTGEGMKIVHECSAWKMVITCRNKIPVDWCSVILQTNMRFNEKKKDQICVVSWRKYKCSK